MITTIFRRFLRRMKNMPRHLFKSNRYHLMFDDHPNIDRKLIPANDPVLGSLKTVLRRCRSFPYDMEVFKKIEPETQFLPYLTSRDKVSLDVGANIGLYSALLSPLSLEVFAWEANPHIIPYLTTNVFRFGNVRILPLAAAKEKGSAEFNVPLAKDGNVVCLSGAGSMMNTFLTKQQIKNMSINVTMFPLDSFDLENVGFLKIDVEGNEYDVLLGATNTIERNRPSIIFENEYRHNPECAKVFEFLMDRSYTGYFFDRNSQHLRPFNEFSLEQHQISLLDNTHNIMDFKSYVYNFLFVPREADSLKSLVVK